MFFDVLLMVIGGLWIFHTFMAVVSLTTYEFMRSDTVPYLEATQDNDFPFSEDPVSNIRLFCWIQGFQLLWKEWRPFEWCVLGEGGGKKNWQARKLGIGG